MVYVKNLHANFGIVSFWLAVNAAEENTVRRVKVLIVQKKYYCLNNTAKGYVQNFIRDFLSLLSESLKEHYQIAETVCIPREKTFDVKSYHKSNKNRSQVVCKKFENCDKLNYSIKGKKRTFYKKI